MVNSCSLNNSLVVKLKNIDNKAMFIASARENQAVIVDYFSPVGTGKGYTSLELLMIAFGSCLSTTLMTLLRHRMKKTISGIEAEVKGTLRREHPKALNSILLLLKIKTTDLMEEEVQNALRIAEDAICPVWSMIKGNVTVEVKTEIISD